MTHVTANQNEGPRVKPTIAAELSSLADVTLCFAFVRSFVGSMLKAPLKYDAAKCYYLTCELIQELI